MCQVLVQVCLSLEEGSTLGTHVLPVLSVDSLGVLVTCVLVFEGFTTYVTQVLFLSAVDNLMKP